MERLRGAAEASHDPVTGPGSWLPTIEIRMLEPEPNPDPYLVCPNCGATMYERGCKLRCRCGYFLSCSDI